VLRSRKHQPIHSLKIHQQKTIQIKFNSFNATLHIIFKES
jgi:hypothetical protein